MSGASPLVAVLVSIGIVLLSAFFVAIEFALVAARRNRLEEAAATSGSARAALKSARELSLLLAGSQLGITLCTLALGAISKPAVHDTMLPLIESVGLPAGTANVLAFVLALLVVTFVHLVVGEMAPKSWAIAHPERSAIMLAIPMRAFMWFTRPLLLALNAMANWCLRRVGVQPVDELSAGRNPDDLRELVEHSVNAGALDAGRRDRLAVALELNTTPVQEIMRSDDDLAEVGPHAGLPEIQRVSRESGHLRLVVRESGRPLGVVHVRDALGGAARTRAADLMRPVQRLSARTPIYSVLSAMREGRSHLILLEDGERLVGFVTLQDVLDRLLPAATPAS